jgi:hypothetical protein
MYSLSVSINISRLIKLKTPLRTLSPNFFSPIFFKLSIFIFFEYNSTPHDLSGNYDGIGKLREHELRASARVLGIQEVTVIDDPNLLDGPRPWPIEHVTNEVNKAIGTFRPDLVSIEFLAKFVSCFHHKLTPRLVIKIRCIQL